jgi:hypothetical protein
MKALRNQSLSLGLQNLKGTGKGDLMPVVEAMGTQVYACTIYCVLI